MAAHDEMQSGRASQITISDQEVDEVSVYSTSTYYPRIAVAGRTSSPGRLGT